MKKEKLNAKDLRFIRSLSDEVIGLLCHEANRLLKRRTVGKSALINAIKEMLEYPTSEQWEGHVLQPIWNVIQIQSGAEKINAEKNTSPKLRPEPIPYTIFGQSNIESKAIDQMNNAMSLPISIAGALMPDAHEGYGLPIGGVLATEENVIIPYAVGVDIACRMCMSVYPISPDNFELKRESFRNALGVHTIFGVGAKNSNHLDASVFDLKEWNSTKIVRQYRNLAYSQLGTSGAGNHFVEWGVLRVIDQSSFNNLVPGNYIALLSHSGSRGFGNEIATFYSRVAMGKNPLPQGAKQLAWLDLTSEEGQEYWIAMNLAGHYASANHREIHEKISREIGVNPLIRIENHHNFAWREKLPNGQWAIIHRKGATPAGKNTIGIIPGSMTHPGYVVKGLGNPHSLNSASHGAGRAMSRSQALKTFSWNEIDFVLKKQNVELIGGDIDEAPMAYKDIDRVMEFQNELVEILAEFQPRIVRMADAERRRH